MIQARVLILLFVLLFPPITLSERSEPASQIGSEAHSVLTVLNDAPSVEQTETGFYYPLGRRNFDSACGRWLARDKLSKPKGCYFGGLYHLGVDMMAKRVGDPVYPIADGEVIGMSTDGEKNAAVFIKHKLSDGSDFVAVYGHIRTSVSARKHSKVTGGVQFATVGPYSGGNHVHLGIHPEVKSDFTVSEKDKRGKVVEMGWGRASNYFWPNANGFVEPISWITTKSPLSNTERPPKHSEPPPVPARPVNLGKCSYSAESIVFSPDGSTMVVGCGDYDRKSAGRNIQIYDVHSGRMRTLGFGDSSILSVSFSPDGRTIASGNEEWRGSCVGCWNGRGKDYRNLLSAKRYQPGWQSMGNERMAIWNRGVCTNW